MQYAVKVARMAAAPLLVVRCRATPAELSKVVPEGCGTVWNFIRHSQVASHGRNVAVYLNGRIDLEVGVEVDANAPTSSDVFLSATPAGVVATTTHIGPYAGLGAAHQSVREWCDTNRRRMAGPNWEIYGHWTDDAAKLRTEVFYLLADET